MVDTTVLSEALAAIRANPAAHDQDVWIRRTECGTAQCLAGWVCLLAGAVPLWTGAFDCQVGYGDEGNSEDGTALVRYEGEPWSVPDLARRLLGLDKHRSKWWPQSGDVATLLFMTENTIDDLELYRDMLAVAEWPQDAYAPMAAHAFVDGKPPGDD